MNVIAERMSPSHFRVTPGNRGCEVLVILCLWMVAVGSVAYAATASPDPQRLEEWARQIRRDRTFPFSFRADGQPARLMQTASRTSRQDGWAITTLEYSLAESSLRVQLICRVSPDRSIVRQTIRLNNGQARSPRLSDMRILDRALSVAGTVKQVVHGLAGAELHSDFEPWSEPLSTTDGRVERDSTRGGRSTTEQFAMWLIAEADRGLWFAPEWSGIWHMVATRSGESMRLVIDLPTFDFILDPNETIDLPTVVYGPYRGDAAAGFNHIRRMVHDHYLPNLGDARPTPQVYFQGLAGHPNWHNEQALYAEVDAAARVGCEAWILDGGWNCPPNKSWVNTLGQWEDHRRFPSGLEKFGRYVKRKGMRFGVWMEPRCVPEGRLYRENKDKFLYMNQRGFMNYPVIDLAIPEGRQLMFDVLDQFVTDYGADWIWFDFNTHPHQHFFKALDERVFPDRKGLAELAWYQGLYEVLERFMAAHPNVWMETCSSGGRLMDLGMLRRSHSVWVTDWSQDDEVSRVVRSGLNRFLPAVYIQNSLFMPGVFKSKRYSLSQDVPKPNTPVAVDRRLPLYFTGNLGYGQGLSRWDEASLRRAEQLTDVYKQMRHYLQGDYYHLFPTIRQSDVWDGWQYHDPATDSGMMIIARLSSDAPPQQNIRLHQPGTPSICTFRILAGQAALSPQKDGVVVEMPVGSIVVHYQRNAEQ